MEVKRNNKLINKNVLTRDQTAMVTSSKRKAIRCLWTVLYSKFLYVLSTVQTLCHHNKKIAEDVNYIPKTVYKKASVYKCFAIEKAMQTKQKLNNWIADTYRPTHFLTIQLPEHLRTSNYDHSKDQLRMYMKIFEKSLFGKHWNKHHLPFIAFAENGAGPEWHFHILLNRGKFTEQELQNAILKTTIKLKLSFYCLELDLIENHLEEVNSYCTKEMKIYWNNKFDSDRMILSADLFNLPYEKVTSMTLNQKN